MSGSVEDLARHRIGYIFRGFPVRDDDGFVTHVIDEPAWQWDDLSDEQQAKIRQEALRCQTGDHSYDEAFRFVLGDYGIACVHEWVNREPTFRECKWCREMQPLPGRVVKVGDDWLRVEDPPPPVLRIPRPIDLAAVAAAGPTADPGLVIDEYRWDGSRYVR